MHPTHQTYYSRSTTNLSCSYDYSSCEIQASDAVFTKYRKRRILLLSIRTHYAHLPSSFVRRGIDDDDEQIIDSFDILGLAAAVAAVAAETFFRGLAGSVSLLLVCRRPPESTAPALKK